MFLFFLFLLPELPAEAGLEVEHLKAVFCFGAEGSGLTHQEGGGRVVGEVVEEERGQWAVSSG